MSLSKLFSQHELMVEVLEFVPVGVDLFHCILSNKTVYHLIHHLHNQFKLDQILFKPWFWFCKPVSIIPKSKSKESEDNQLLVKPFFAKPFLPNKLFLQQKVKWLTHEHCLDPFFTYIRLLCLDQETNTLYSETEQELLAMLLVRCSWNILGVQYCKIPLLEKIGLQVRTLFNQLSTAVQNNSINNAKELITEGCNSFYPFANLQNTYLYSYFYKLRNIILKKQNKKFLELPNPIAIMVLLNAFSDLQVLTEEQKQDEEIAFWAVGIKSERLLQYQSMIGCSHIVKNRQIALLAMRDTTINGKEKVIPIDDEFKIDKSFWMQVIAINPMALKLVLQIPELYNNKNVSFVKQLLLRQPCAIDEISEEKAKEILNSDNKFKEKMCQLYPPALRFIKILYNFKDAYPIFEYNPAYLASLAKGYDDKGNRRVFKVTAGEFKAFALQHPEALFAGHYVDNNEVRELYKNDEAFYKEILNMDPFIGLYAFNARNSLEDLKMFDAVIDTKYGKCPTKLFPMRYNFFFPKRPKQFGVANMNNQYKYFNSDIYGFLENMKWLDPSTYMAIYCQSYQTKRKCSFSDLTTMVKAFPFILGTREQWSGKADAGEKQMTKLLRIALNRCPAVEKLYSIKEWASLEDEIQ